MNMQEAALTYHRRGWVPIPLVGKKPSIGSWLRFQTERPSEETVSAWFAERGGAGPNIGLVCGAISGMVVVDLDGDVALAYEYLLSQGIPFEACPKVQTGKGYHLYYQHPGIPVANGVGVYKRETQDGRSIAIDIRGDGGYVVAPPSKHPTTGRQYEWQDDGWAGIVSLPELPEAFRKAQPAPKIQPTSSAVGMAEATNLLQPVGEGGRNAAAARLAGYLLRVTGEDTDASMSMLRVWNAQNTPPLPDRELTRTFDSIVAKRQRDPETRKREQSEPTPTMILSGKEWADAVREMPPRIGVETAALPTIDRMGGLVPRDLVILAGRPGMGKSTCAWNIVADACIGQRVPTAVFSTEMTANDVARWMASKLHETPVRDITPEQWRDTLERIAAAPVTMIDQGSLSIVDIEEAIAARPETRIAIIDHVQRIRTPGRESRNHEIGQIAQRLKSLAKDTPCTVVLLSQMNRASDNNGRPTLAALRDSGELEQEADGVIFLWSKADDPTANPLEVEFFLAKNRHGPLTDATYRFHKHLKNFEPVSGHEILLQTEREREHKEKEYAMIHGLPFG